MTAEKYFSKIIFQCKCVLFFTVIFFNSFTKEMPGEGEWTLWHCCISRKFSGYMYARYASVDMGI